MPTEQEPHQARRPRADAERNRLRLMQTARATFAEKGSLVSLDEIARAAGVGIGTLYRHFPTRDALVAAVYSEESRQLADAAATLLETQPPLEALRQWLRLFVEYLATKRILAEALEGMVGGTAELFAQSGAQMKKALSLLIGRAAEEGEITPPAEPLDLLRAIVGVVSVAPSPDRDESARRIVELLVAGLQARG